MRFTVAGIILGIVMLPRFRKALDLDHLEADIAVLGMPYGAAYSAADFTNDQTNALAAQALKLTAKDNLALGIVDAVIPEPVGGARAEGCPDCRRLPRDLGA